MNKENLIEKVGFKKYFKAASWAEYNKQFFDGLAKKYDATNALHSFGSKKYIDQKAVSRLEIPEKAKILDLCAGSGDISIEIIRQNPTVQVIAFDASEEMLKIAKQKAEKAGILNNINFQVGDALNLPFDDKSFDVCVISFGLRNLTDIKAGLKEMQRVTKSGGCLSNIDQGKPTNILFNMIYQVYFYRIAPLIGKLVFHLGEFNSFKYLPESNKYFPSQDELVKIMQDLGLKNITNYNYIVGAVAQQVALVL